MKTCTKCGQSKPITEFGKHAKSRDGLRCWCKACEKITFSEWQTANRERVRTLNAKWQAANPEKAKAAVAKWRAANSEKVRAFSEKWAAANPEALRINSHNRRAREREVGGKLSKGLSAKLFKLQRGKCACGCKQPLGKDYHLDHIMPLKLGGPNTDDNIQLLTATCNLQKSARHPVDFMRKRGFLI